MIRCFEAISLGPAVPRGSFDGTVHSVFRRAINLRLSGEVVLLTLILSKEADLPQGIRFDAPGWSDFEGLSVGVRAACRDGALVVGDYLAVDLRTAAAWECDLSSLTVDLTRPAAAAAWACAWHALKERQARSGFSIVGADLRNQSSTQQSALTRHLSQGVRAILQATIDYDLDAIVALGTLVGAGVGLTPSGDDFLTGYLAGLWCTSSRTPERRVFLSAANNLVTQYSAQTNDIARTFLLLAARGQVSRSLIHLADCIARGAGTGSVVSCARAAMRMGHSSGMDAVTGLLLGLAVWDRPDLVLPL